MPDAARLPPFPRVASLRTAEAFRAHLTRNAIALDFDETLRTGAASPLAAPIEAGGLRAGNRFCVLPMEGWDGTCDGEPTDLTRRRWRNFGASGAKLIWGGEAVAVRHDGRANPNQLMLTARTHAAIAGLRDELGAAHRERFGANADKDLSVGLQLTHSGRHSRPDVWDRPAPLAACRNSVLDRRLRAPARLVTDDELDRLADDFVAAARLARDAGFQFVDINHCHGYLGQELLGARARPGRYGGALEHRLGFLRRIVEGIQAEIPGLEIAVRLSAFDSVPYRKSASGVGVPEDHDGMAEAGFGVVHDEDLDGALAESRALLGMLEALGVRWISVTGGSPYYCPHVQRPAFFPPMDGYQPPEDPLHGVARHLRATAMLKAAFPRLVFVGSAYSYLQDWLPNVAQHSVGRGLTDLVGLGRMILAYPDLPADLLSGAPLRRQSICRTFSDCTTGPRLGLVSGCYPLDPFYKARPEASRIRTVRTQLAVSEES
jgi:2,4-dienoyl-CoA reductase-like NADH-dependent reductase (Old Yellow Enzyme family)